MRWKLGKTILFLLVMVLVLAGCSGNPLTGRLGPSWDLTLRLPVDSYEYLLEDDINIDEDFEDDYEKIVGFGMTTGEDEIEELFARVIADEPLTETKEFDLPDLKAEMDGISEEESATISGEGEEDLITIEFPALTLGSSGNTIDIEVENTGSNTIDELTLELWDTDGDDSPLATIELTDIEEDDVEEGSLDLTGKEIEEDDLEIKASYNQSSGDASFTVTATGLDEISIRKADDLDMSDITLTESSLTVEEDKLISLDDFEDTVARLGFTYTLPDSTNLELDLTEVELADTEGTISDDDNEFYWDEGSIEFGELVMTGTPELDDDKLDYDASDTIEVEVEIIGELNVAADEYVPDDLEVEDGDLVIKTEPQTVEITQEDIDEIKDGVFKADKTFLETTINNEMGMEMQGEVYLSNDDTEDDLYDEDNKVNSDFFSIEVGENDAQRFMLGEHIDELEELLTEGDVYMGVKVIAGDLEDDEEAIFNFTKDSELVIDGNIAVVIGINQ
ncbi:MAG: hypothetical protein ACOCQH_00965 [Halanaerobiales bacterium]